MSEIIQPVIKMIDITRSDYLDNSNPRRLLAFFLFCDAANMARRGIASCPVEDPRMRRPLLALFESTRQRAEQEAINVLAGESLYVELAESNLNE